MKKLGTFAFLLFAAAAVAQETTQSSADKIALAVQQAISQGATFTVNVTAPATGTLRTTVNLTGTFAEDTDTASTSFAITPAVANCTYSALPTTVNVPASTGQSGTIQVSAPSGCAWVVSIVRSADLSHGPWISISPMSGTGNGIVGYTVIPGLLPDVDVGELVIGQATAADVNFTIICDKVVCG